VDILASSVPRFTNYLTLPQAAPKTEFETQYEGKMAPLGHLRLKIIELVNHLIRLNK